MNKTIGVVAALPREAKALAGQPCRRKAGKFPCCQTVLKNETRLMVVQSGMGMENAFSAAMWLCQKGAAVLGAFGVSGGLNPGLETGDVLWANSVLLKDAEAVSLVWKKGVYFDEVLKCIAAESLRVHRGPVITLQKPVLDAEGKKALFHQTKALAADMETAAVARAANQTNLPFFAIRTICDPADLSVSESLFQCVDEKGRPRLFYLLKQILRKPLLISRLLHMNRNFHMALAGLTHIRRCLAEMTIPPAP